MQKPTRIVYHVIRNSTEEYETGMYYFLCIWVRLSILLFSITVALYIVLCMVFSIFRIFSVIIIMLFTARRYAKRGICRRRVSVRLSVRLCVCLSHSKRLNVGSRK